MFFTVQYLKDDLFLEKKEKAQKQNVLVCLVANIESPFYATFIFAHVLIVGLYNYFIRLFVLIMKLKKSHRCLFVKLLSLV